MSASVFLIFLFSFFAPTIAFCSLNTQFFTSSQIIGSLCVSFLAGTLAALGCAWAIHIFGNPWPAFFAPVVAIICFILFSERMFSEVFQSPRKRWIFYGSLVVLSALFSFFHINYITASLLGVYGLFSTYDMVKNWRREKIPLFNPEEIGAPLKPKNSTEFKTKPNVYLLLLESFHSAKAIKEAYNLKINESAEAFLRQHGFTIYPETFSNKHSTPLSLKTLLSTSLAYSAPPQVLQNFIHNGYKCFFFDTMYFLSQPYAKFAANAHMPPWVASLYSRLGPLFAQSRYLRSFVKNIDPFETTESSRTFGDMRKDFLEHLANCKSPSFNVLHFGAMHFGDLWYRVQTPGPIYTQRYKQGLAQLELITNDILAEDPDALIVAVGDHGAYHWQGVFVGPDAPEKNALANGVSPNQLAHDFFGVVLGIHWGKVTPPPTGILSHVNIFKWVMAALSGKNRPQTLEENISILQGTHIAVRNGKPLSSYEPLQNRLFGDYYPDMFVNHELFGATRKVEQKLAKNNLEGLDEDAEKLLQLARHTSPPTLQHFNAAQALVKAGRVNEGVELLNECWHAQSEALFYEPFTYLVQSAMSLKNYNMAKAAVDKCLEKPKWAHRWATLMLMRILWAQEKYADIIPLGEKIFDMPRDLICEPVDRFPFEATLTAYALERARGYREVSAWLDKMLDKYPAQSSQTTVLLMLKVTFCQKNDPKNLVPLLRDIMRRDQFPIMAPLICLRSLILNNDRDAALAIKDTLDGFPELKANSLYIVMSQELLKKGSPEYFKSIKTMELLCKEQGNNKFFDQQWYEQTYSPNEPAFMDYLRNGLALLRNPAQNFDMRFYICANPLIAERGLYPHLHYLSSQGFFPRSLSEETFIQMRIHPLLKKDKENTK